MGKILGHSKEAWIDEREIAVSLEDVAVGDVVEFFGAHWKDGRAGIRFATVDRIEPRLRRLRVACRIETDGSTTTYWTARIWEPQVIANHGPRRNRR